MNKILVSDIMTREPLVTSPSTNLLECAKKMVQKRTGSLLLLDNKRLVGLISTQDILWALVKKSKDDLSKIEAKDISPRKIAVIRPSATLDEALKKIREQPFKETDIKRDIDYVIKKLGLTDTEFREIWNKPNRTFLNYPSYYPLIKNLIKIVRPWATSVLKVKPKIFFEMEVRN